MRGRRACIVVLVPALALAGCGSSDDEQTGLSTGQAQALLAQLEAARASAAARDVEGTKAALVKFRASVARLRRSGDLSDAAARSLRVGAARLLQRVESDNAAPVETAPATPTETTPAPEPPGKAKKHGKKGKDGKGKHGEDEEGDE